MAIDAKQAVQAARSYLNQIQGGVPYNLNVEEVDQTPNKRYWLITLGYNESAFINSKVYKIFTIAADDGEVVSMKIAHVKRI